MAMPLLQQWSLARLQEVDETPWSKAEGPAPVIVPQEQLPDRTAPAPEVITRRLYIYQRDLDKFGYTPNCPRCDYILEHGADRA